MNKMKIKNFSLFLFLFLIPVSICNDNFIKDASTNSIKDNELQNDERTFLKDYWDEVEVKILKRNHINCIENSLFFHSSYKI